MRKLLVALVVIAFGASSRAVQAQDSAPQSPTFRSGIDLVTVDVGVVDPKGKPVDDLHASDFIVKIDGQVRRVVSANLVRIDPEAAKKKIAGKEETFFTTNLTPPEGRQIVIAVDQVNARPGSMKSLMRTAAQFIDRLSPLDQVSFLAFPEPGPRVPFTTDRLRIKLAMDRLLGHDTGLAVSRMNIGVTEALAIDERHDDVTLAQVTGRECRAFRGLGVEECERDVIAQAADIAHRARETAETGLRGLMDLLRQLALVDGAKSVILLSEGIAVGNAADLDLVATLAGRARASLNVLIVDEQRGDVAIMQTGATADADRRRQVSGLQNIAAASRGAVFQAVGTAEGVFERLMLEMSAYYVLGVEQRPGDDNEDRSHRVDVEVQRRNVTIRSPQAFALSSAARPKRSTEDNLRSALMAPFAVAEIPLRVTTFAQQDPAGHKVRVSVAADVGQPGTPAAAYNVAYLLVDRDNRVVANFAQRVPLGGSDQLATEALAFLSSASVDPGIYTLHLAVVDGEGRRGSVIREVSAWKMQGEELATSDLVVSTPPAGGQGLRPAVEPHVTADAIAAFVELYTTAPPIFDSTSVTFEIADDPDGAALTRVPATMMPGRQGEWRVAQAFIPVAALPPGRYVARAQVARAGKTVSVLSRPLFVERPTAAAGGAVAAPAFTFAATIPKFDRDAMLRPELVGSMLDEIEKRSPALKRAMTEARAGRYGPAALEALSAGDQEVAAFLRGFDLFAKGQLDQAATQLQAAAGPRREFFPAAFYLGAVFAAAGRDRDAAGTWQLALGTELRPAIAYVAAADARLRDGSAASAVDILRPAHARTPADDEIGRRLAIACLMTNQYAEALPILDGYLSRHATDQDLLFAAVVVQYELVRAGQTLSVADRDKMRRYASAYKGDQNALVEKYLQSMGAR